MYLGAIASSRQSFLSNFFSFRYSFKPKHNIKLTRPNSISCNAKLHTMKTNLTGNILYFSIEFIRFNFRIYLIQELFIYLFVRRNENQLAKLAIATLAVSVLALGSVGVASAAMSGGRIGGQAFRSSAPRPPRLHQELTTDRGNYIFFVT